MAVNNAYAQYNNNKVLTASPAELTLLLYEGAIKFCNIAMMGIEEKNIQKAHDNIKKAQAIIEELQATLNHSYKVAEDLIMYTGIFTIYWYRRICIRIKKY